jgi:hypothetical protein
MNKLSLFFFISLFLFSCRKGDFFQWNLTNVPDVSDLKLESNSILKFKVSANFKSNGHDKNAKLGFLISSNNNDFKINNSDSIIFLENKNWGIIDTEINWKSTNKVYCRAFIVNKLDTVYTTIIEINWSGNVNNLPVVETFPPSEIRFFSIKCGVNLINDGGLPIKRKGVLVSTSNQPNLDNSYITLSNNIENEIQEISNLNDNTQYYVRGFAENMAGIVYANYVFSITTKRFYEIGEIGPAGGFIFYNKLDFEGGWNFMECASSDINILLPWSLSNNQIQNLQTSLGSGESNTQLIVNTLGLTGNNYAAKESFNYSINGYTDWYLPSRDELLKVYQNLFLNGIGGFYENQSYWTSSKDDFFNQNAWCQKMNIMSPNPFSDSKLQTHRVRVVRCF